MFFIADRQQETKRYRYDTGIVNGNVRVNT